MRAELVELLRTREIRHPSRSVRLESDCAWDLSVELSGYPWWLANPQSRCDGSLTPHFEGITDGVLHSDLFHADPFYEDLGSLEARPLTEYRWARGAHCNLFCSTPLPDALGVYVKLHDFCYQLIARMGLSTI